MSELQSTGTTSRSEAGNLAQSVRPFNTDEVEVTNVTEQTKVGKDGFLVHVGKSTEAPARTLLMGGLAVHNEEASPVITANQSTELNKLNKDVSPPKRRRTMAQKTGGIRNIVMPSRPLHPKTKIVRYTANNSKFGLYSGEGKI
jgi:hypothetical protein